MTFPFDVKIGTKSVLFGVHQFLWHPWTVYRAWCYIYGPPTTWTQLLAILLHDAGYVGMPNIDGPEGKQHPHRGATWVGKIVRFFGGNDWAAYFFAVCHSRCAAAEIGLPVSALYAADKLSIFFEPDWLYLLRARLSGEIKEFKSNDGMADKTDREWLRAYKKDVLGRPEIARLL